jgi:predicted nucleotidyltransferase
MRREHVMGILSEHVQEMRERFGVVSLRLFGSVVRDEARSAGDIDILVDLGGPAGFSQYMDLLFFLEDLLGEKVDLVTVRGLREELRPEVEREAVRVA